MKEERKILVVYNTCGINFNRDNTDWYIQCIDSLLNQDFEGFHVVLSSCLNSPECIRKLYSIFGNRISYSLVAEPLTVNVTFNKAVQECVKSFGEFESYLYVDSGCTFNDQKNVLAEAYKSFKTNDYGMLALQIDNDTGYEQLGLDHDPKEIQIKGEDFIIPLGKACNAHVILYSNEILKTFNNKIWPDVFAAFCTESTFSFLCSTIKKRWAILKDIEVEHQKAVDGASCSVPHCSPLHKNPWNNLLFGRDAKDFINDPEAIEAGLGYEECNEIMMHDSTKYDENSYPKNSQKLIEVITKYFFLTKEELDYDNIKYRFVS
tara:strand:+ start:1386 stop:2345 length:960 start_codon:yes stop_codon:yes gene_type:complete